jgi:uncharacterized membrane protein
MRLRAFLTGLVVPFVTTGVLFLTGGDARKLLLLHAAGYGIAGLVVGRAGRKASLGVWLAAAWFATQIVTSPLAGAGAFPRNGAEWVGNLIENLVVVGAAGLGAAAGATTSQSGLLGDKGERQ